MKKLFSFVLVVVLVVSMGIFPGAANNKPEQVTGVKTVYVSSNSVKIKWKSVKKASGYKIYKYNDSSKKYKVLKTTKNTSETVTGLKSGKKYKLAVRAFKKVDGKLYYGKVSGKIGFTTAKVRKSDIKQLEELLTCMELYGYRYNLGYDAMKKYNYNTSSYKKMLQFIDDTSGFYIGVQEVLRQCGWSYASKSYEFDYDSSRDPLGIIAGKIEYYSNGYSERKYQGYTKIDAEKFDWAIRNIYNKKPNHNNSVIQSAYGWEEVYYYNGYYYFPLVITGDVFPPIKVVSSKNSSSGVYSLKIRAYIAGENTPISSTYTVSARLKKVDGKRIWSIYSLK